MNYDPVIKCVRVYVCMYIYIYKNVNKSHLDVPLSSTVSPFLISPLDKCLIMY